MADTEQTRGIVRRYFETMSARDWDGFGALMAEDAVYELPQTGELITERGRVVSFNRDYPGDWRLSVTRLIADGETAAASMNFTLDGEAMVALVYFELAGGLITRVTDFWPETYEPPAGREHLTEQRVSGVDSFGRSDGS